MASGIIQSKNFFSTAELLLEQNDNLNKDYYENLFGNILTLESRKKLDPSLVAKIENFQQRLFVRCLPLLDKKEIYATDNFFNSFVLCASCFVKIENADELIQCINRSNALFFKHIKKQDPNKPVLRICSDVKNHKYTNPKVEEKEVNAIFNPAVQFIIGEWPTTEKERAELEHFESGNPLWCTKYLIKFIKKIEKTKPDEILEFLVILRNRLCRGLSITTEIENLRTQFQRVPKNKEEKINRFKNLFCPLLIGMQPGYGIAFSGGYSSHAIIYEIEMQENYLYCFRKINTGEGNQESIGSYFGNLIESWVNEQQNLPRKKNNIVHVFQNISLKQLASWEMMELLLNVENRYDAINKIEEKLKVILDQSPKEQFESYLQHLGTCSMSSLWGWLKYHFHHIGINQSQIEKYSLKFLKMSIKDLIKIQIQLSDFHYNKNWHLTKGDVSIKNITDWNEQLKYLYKRINPSDEEVKEERILPRLLMEISKIVAFGIKTYKDSTRDPLELTIKF